MSVRQRRRILLFNGEGDCLGAKLGPATYTVPRTGLTTLSDGSEVNFNIYAAKTDVYLDGGPPVGAPAGAAGLPGPGTLSSWPTDPSGKTLLSTDLPSAGN